MNSQTFWLSEQPIAGSKSWDAAITRIVTWAKFKDLKTKKVFFVFNTHFDHRGTVARRESANLLLKKID
jgi:endonuclease/exonuclease/phosphatase family metal-dependent hydrolase